MQHNGDERPSNFIRPFSILDYVDRNLRHVPALKVSHRVIKVLDSRQNSISTIANTLLTIYSNSKIIDPRQNPGPCSRINLVAITTKSECPIPTTLSKVNPSPDQYTPQSISSEAPKILSLEAAMLHSPCFLKLPPNRYTRISHRAACVEERVVLPRLKVSNINLKCTY